MQGLVNMQGAVNSQGAGQQSGGRSTVRGQVNSQGAGQQSGQQSGGRSTVRSTVRGQVNSQGVCQQSGQHAGVGWSTCNGQVNSQGADQPDPSRLTCAALPLPLCLFYKHLCLLGDVEFGGLGCRRTHSPLADLKVHRSLEQLHNEGTTLGDHHQGSILTAEPAKPKAHNSVLQCGGRGWDDNWCSSPLRL